MNNYCLSCGNRLDTDNEFHWHDNCIKRMFETSKFPDLSCFRTEFINIASHFLDTGSSVSGVQKKLSMSITKSSRQISRLTIFNGPSEYIIKTFDKDMPCLPEYENLVMTMAGKAKIETVLHGIFKLEGIGYFYITKRIDRDKERKFPMEDFCQLSGKQTEYKYSGSYEACYRSVVSKFSSQKELDAIKFFNLVLFSYLVGNTDMHLKNFSLIDRGDGYKLAPGYDLVPSELLVNQHEMALSLNGKRKNLHRKDFFIFAENMCINHKLATALISRMINYENLWQECIENSILPLTEKQKYQQFLNMRLNQFLNQQ